MLNFVPANSRSLADLVDGVNRGYEGYVGEFSPETVESYAQFIREQQLDLDLSLLALDQAGRTAGVAVIGRRGERGWVGDFAVVPQWRGTGASKRLLQAVLQRCREAGIRLVRLDVDPKNVAARRLYAGAGFRETRVLHNFNASIRQIQRLIGGSGVSIEAVAAEKLVPWLAREPVRPAWDHEIEALLAGDGQVIAALVGGREVAVLQFAKRDDEVDLLYLGVDGAEIGHLRALLASVSRDVETVLRASYVPDNSPMLAIWRELGFKEDSQDLEMELLL